MQPPVGTAATDRFSDSLRTWQNPSFLAPLGHHIDRDGPAGLITSIATVQPSPQAETYHPDRPLPPANGADAQVQRSVTSWPVPPAARSWLVSAPKVDHDPVPLAAVSADVAATEREPASTENASARHQERAIASPDLLAGPADPPAGSTAPPLNLAGGGDEAKTTAPTLQSGQLDTSMTPGHPQPADRGPAGVTVQRQSPEALPQTATRRLGLGAPLNDSPVRAESVPSHRPAASDPGPAALADPGQGVPWGTAPVAWGSGADPGPPAAPPQRRPGPGAGWPPGPAEAAELSPGEVASPAGPSPEDQAVQRAEAPPAAAPLPGAPLPEVPLAEARPTEPPLADAPLLGELPLVMRSGKPSLAGPAPPAAQRVTAIPGGSPPASATAPAPATPPAPATAPAYIQRLAGPSAGPGGTLGRRSPDPAVAVWQPAGPKPGPGFPSPDVRQAGLPDRAPPVQRISPPVPFAGSTATLPPPRHAAVAPLLGQRQQVPGQWQQVPEAGTPFHAQPGPVPVQAAVMPATSARPGVVPGPAPVAVQPSAADRPAPRWTSGLVTGLAAGPAADRREPPPGLPDPGTVAVAQGLAHRDPDGSVVFDLRPSLVPSDQAMPPPPADGQPGGASGLQHTVQRQEAAGPVDSPTTPADSAPSAIDGTPSPPTMSAGQVAPAASGLASPPLDELARQLFGPLAARLKAELRLDRERGGLLTDLRR
jgi:hypothetical protein